MAASGWRFHATGDIFTTLMNDISRLTSALADRCRIEWAPGAGGASDTESRTGLQRPGRPESPFPR